MVDGSIIVGVTADEPANYLHDALSTLGSLGANVSDVQTRGVFGFVAQKSFPHKTALRKVTTAAPAVWFPPHFTVSITGRPSNRQNHTLPCSYLYRSGNVRT